MRIEAFAGICAKLSLAHINCFCRYASRELDAKAGTWELLYLRLSVSDGITKVVVQVQLA